MTPTPTTPETAPAARIPLIGETAPAFKAHTTQGPINFPKGASSTEAVRAVFIIDPKAKIRAVLFYPLSNGRNFPEIKRLLIGLQTSDQHGCATPADWQPGEDVIVPPPGSCGTAKERVENPDPDAYALDWFMTFKKLPKVG